jgi:hypothetical protein
LVDRVGYAGQFLHQPPLNNAQSDELFRQCLETDGTQVNRTCDDGLEPLDWNLEYRKKECIDDRFAVPSEMESNLRNKVNKVLERHKDATPHPDGSRRLKELGDTLDTTPTVFTLSNIVTLLAVVQAIRHFFRKTHRRQRAKAMLQHTLHSVFGN